MAADGSGPGRLTSHEADDFQPAWSPLGDCIAFTSARDGNREIYLMNTDGSALVRLTSNRADDFHPSWSPDGTLVAFTSERDGNRELYVMNADGSGLSRLTDDPAGLAACLVTLACDSDEPTVADCRSPLSC